MRKHFVYYALSGAVFGFLFPLIATGIKIQEIQLKGLSVLQYHFQEPLFWVIDTAPLVLGLCAYLVGKFIEYTTISVGQIREHSESKFQAVFDRCPYPLLVFSDQGIVDCNPAAVEVLGCKSKEDLLSHHPAVFSSETQPDGRSSKEKSIEMDRLAREKGVHVFEWLHQKIDGTKIPVEVTLARISILGKTQLLVHWRDLTEIKKIQANLIESTKLSSLGEMAAGMAHEINNPLTIILGHTTLLKNKVMNANIDVVDAITSLEKIEKTVKRIEKIIIGLRSFSKNSDTIEMTQVKLKKIIENTLVFCKERFKSHDVDLRVNNDFEEDLVILGHQSQLSQVLLNVLNNAFDAVVNLKTRWVELAVEVNDERVSLIITDSGLGIPDSISEKMMMPFYTTKPVGKGTGLGLSIAKGIIESHRGEIRYDPSSLNTRFIITLPRFDAAKLAG